MFPEMQLWLKVLLAIAVAVIISFGTTPIVKTFAQKVGAMDVPDQVRHIHKQPTPRMGGLAIFFGFLVSTLLFVDISREVQGILIGAVIIVATGVVDDIVCLKYYVKLIAQVLAAVVASAHGVVIQVLSNPNVFSANETLFIGYLGIPVTLIWIVGVTNAVNLIDGLDGLACGVSAISSVTMLVVALLVSEPGVALLLAALAGGCLGFIPYNLNPAKIFMGDTGALLLGYVLATVSIMGMFKVYAVVTFLVPILALALPLFDTLYAVIRRLLHGQNPMTPDRGHLHHRLIDHGLSQKQAVAVLYSLSAMLGLTAVVICTNGKLRLLLILLDLLIAIAVGLFIYRTIEHPENPAAAQSASQGKPPQQEETK
ncbi:MAG: undecaprenyl/decaprenyl-phosphate alpha-N-acetylglucosaminyl 1-phosphate transferase [Oscillospiraceae bacterium]|nr:undecaprenyl/decaprenyl-phosphate alpha-N-acetylglucosaminyl 1-phosphate transferase [Oscillospiraceae bacterium]